VFLIQRLFASGGAASFDEALSQHRRTTMPKNDRKAALVAILLSALMVLLLSACGTPDTSMSAAQPNEAATTAATADATLTPTLPAEASSTAVGATASATETAETTPATTSTEVTPTAATATPEPVDDTDPFTGTDDLTDTEDLTVTVELTSTQTMTSTHPVALAIADAFGVPVSEVIALHADGLGFGEIARAYFLARELAADADPTNDLTAAQILAMHQSGQGWGQIVATLGLPRGNSHRNLGLIMRAHKALEETTTATPSATENGDDHGPATAPPGQTKHDDKGNGKDKQHGNGKGNGHGNGKGNGGGKKDK